MNDIDRQFTLWLSGYYEDFQTMRVISEGEDYAENSFFTNRRDSHAGNTMAAQAYNNSRFAYDYLTRSFTAKMPAPLVGQSSGDASASLHNEGPSQWLTHDPNRIGATFFEGRATLTYPDTIGDAASLRTTGYPRRADYSHFASGWGTQNTYYVRHGDTDATYERSSFTVNVLNGNPYGAVSTRGYGKFDITSLQPAPTSGVPEGRLSPKNAFDNYRLHKVMHSSSLCGVYLGETGEQAFTGSFSTPYAYLYPIKSPSGKPFFRHTLSRRYADWVSCITVANGSLVRFNFADGINFGILGSLASDDRWFARNVTLTTVVGTGLSFSSGASSITLPNSLPSPPPVTNVLDPSVDPHLPNKTGSSPTQEVFIEGTKYEYSSFSVNGSGDITFNLTTNLTQTYIQPSVSYYLWVNQAADDNTITFYNLTTAGTPTPTPVFQYRQDTDDGLGNPMLCFKNNAGVVQTTNARTTNGQVGVQNSPTFNVSSNTSLGYTYHQMTVNLVSGHGGFDADPLYFAARDPFFTIGNVYGRLQVGDYLTRYTSSTPGRITAINTDGTIDTDLVFDGAYTAYVRQATYGSGNGGTTGRSKDGMFGYQPVIVGDTELNAQADGERFTIRLANQSFKESNIVLGGQVDPTYMLAVGYNKNEAGFALNERGNVLDSKAAITHQFRPVSGVGLSSSRNTLFTQWNHGTTGSNSYTMDQLWYDLDIVVDFSAQGYYVFSDGTLVGSLNPFNAKTGGGVWAADDFYGWSLGVQLQNEKDANDTTSWANIVTMIDRAGYIYAISDRMTHASIPANIQQDDVIFDKFKIKSLVDGITQAEFNVADDSDSINLPQLVSGRPNWKMLLFRDSDYRPIHSSIITAVNFKQNTKKKSKELILKSQDSIGELDFQFPYFDIGQENGAPSLVAHYRRYEISNYAEIFHFGTTSLLNLNALLGFDEDSKGSTGEYLPRYDQRMRLYSGHPIQLYSNENTNGPNYTEDAWEVSRLIDHFRPDLVDATKTRVMLKSDFLPYADDQIPAGVQVAIKGAWRNVGVGGTPNSPKSLPKFAEQGLITANGQSVTNADITPHNEMRGLHTTLQAQSVMTTNTTASASYITLADTSLFPASGTVKVGGTGASQQGATQYTYTSKNAGGLFISGTTGVTWGAGTVVKETTATDYFIIDKTWNRSLKLVKIEDNNGFLQMNFEPDSSASYKKYEFMGGTGYESADSVFAKNDKMTPTTAPNPELIRIYVQPNAAGISHNSNMADLPSQVYTSSEIITNANGVGNIKTTVQVSSLSSGLQAALPITIGTGIGDGLEADLAYMTFPKERSGSRSLTNVGSSYNYRNVHTRWMRDLPQSLWFQKTYGVISEYPYGATAWRGAGYLSAALSNLGAPFNSGSDTTITVGDVTNFPYSGVCEVWTNNPNPFLTNSEQAIMLTSFTYIGKNFVNNTLTNVKFADPNKGVIATSGGAGNRTVIARNIDGDYKHCFVLFADMRNDGSADADGGTRKTDFGLLHPIESNYKLKVVWADSGKSFVDLKIGADADLWQINAKNDPSTGTAWSDNPSAFMLDYDHEAIILTGQRSDQTELSTYYHDWEDKAGAFVIVDLSKFFNLNTEANLGRIAQKAGGNKQLGQFLVEGAGEPTLIDNYHYQAAATYQNSAAPLLQHFNTYRWADAKTVLTQDLVSSSPVTQLAQSAAPGDTELIVVDSTSFPTSATNVLVDADSFQYTGKGGSVFSAGPANLGTDVTGNGTFTTSGGGATVNAAGTYRAEFELTTVTGGTFTAGSGWGASQTYIWVAIEGDAKGTIASNGSGALDATTISITRNDFYLSGSPPVISIVNPPSSATGGFDPVTSLVLKSAGQLKFGEQFTITNAGIGFSSAPTFNFSTSSTATGQVVLNSNQLTGVTGIGAFHVPGVAVSFSSALTSLDVEDTSNFPVNLGVGAFAGQNTAGIIEAKTDDGNGNEYDVKYVFTYSSKTATTLDGIKYRPVKQGETIDTAAAGLWSGDTFTITGVPSIKAEGSLIRASLGSAFPMGFMLKLEGKIKTAGKGGFYEHDKIRIYQQSALFDDWFKQMTLPALSDFNNVPIMEDYNVSGNVAGAGTVESFGSVTQAQNKSIFQTLRTMAQAAGVGSAGSLITLNFQMGRDNRMEFRPTYNSGISLDRNNLKVSDLKTSKAKAFSHVRVLYNGGDSFVTFPALNYKDNVRFKFVSAISVTSYAQAIEIAKMEYQKKKEAAFKVEAEVIRESNETQRVGPMLENARYGYIADPAVQFTGENGGYWTAHRGGMLFGGQNNALHGNIHGYGLLSLLNYQAVSNMGIGIGGYAGADDYTTTYGNGLAHYPTNDLYNAFPWTQMYYWYGAKSVSYAVQIVHIPKGMPKLSETTNNELRIFISDAVTSLPAADREDNLTATKKFNIHFADYSFNTTQSVARCPTLGATQQGIETITTLGNGYFEVPIPASYWAAGNTAGAKMVVSVNAEYLNAIARHKTADKFGGNAMATQAQVSAAGGQTLPTFTNVNEFSIFPLGIREYPELGSAGTGRACWYAPRIHITDDMNFIPGTYVQYNDPYIDINETMFITRVEYEYSSKALDKTKITLERESGRMAEGLEGYLATNPLEDTGASGGGVGGGGGGQNTPPAGGGTGGRDGDDHYAPPTDGNFPFGYTGGQVGTEFSNTSPPLMGGVGADLGTVQKPIFSGTEYIRLNNDTGIQQMGQEGAMGLKSLNANNLDATTLNKFNGTMSIDNLLPNGVQGIPGQPRPAKIPQKTRAMEGIDTKFVSAEGEAAETDGGWILPGMSTIGIAEAITKVQHSLVLAGTVPMDSAQPVLGLTAFISAEILDGNKKFTLETTITCEDTNETITHSHTVDVSQSGGINIVNRKQITLIPQQFFASAGVEGRRLRATITRKPGQGVDTMDFSSVVIHGVQFENVVHNNQGEPATQNLAPFSGTNKDTTSGGFNVNSGNSPL